MGPIEEVLFFFGFRYCTHRVFFCFLCLFSDSCFLCLFLLLFFVFVLLFVVFIVFIVFFYFFCLIYFVLPSRACVCCCRLPRDEPRRVVVGFPRLVRLARFRAMMNDIFSHPQKQSGEHWFALFTCACHSGILLV